MNACARWRQTGRAGALRMVPQCCNFLSLHFLRLEINVRASTHHPRGWRRGIVQKRFGFRSAAAHEAKTIALFLLLRRP